MSSRLAHTITRFFPLPPPEKRRGWLLLLAGAVSVLAVVWVIAPSKAEREGREIAERIKQRLKEPGDWVKVSEIYPGEWSEVCVLGTASLEGALGKRRLASLVGVPVPDLKVPHGLADATSRSSVLIVFYPPHTAKVFSVNNDELFLSGVFPKDDARNRNCRLKEQAVLRMYSSELDGSFRGVTLATFQQIEKLKELEEQR